MQCKHTVPQLPSREASASAATDSFKPSVQSRQEKELRNDDRPANILLPEKREGGQGLKGLKGSGTAESRKEGVAKGREGSDAAAQELALIRMALSQTPEDAVEDADMLLAKKLQAEELQKSRPSVSLSKKRTASTLDKFFKRQKL